MKKMSFLGMFHLLLGANILLWLNAGTYQLIGDAIPAVVKFGLVAMWFALSILRSNGFLSQFAVVSYLLALFYLICLMSKLAGIGGYFSQYSMNFLYILIDMAILCYYYCYGTKTEIKILLIIYLLDMAVIAIRTFIMLQEAPDLVRIMSTSGEHKQAVFGESLPKGIGAYGFCYELVLLQPLLSYWFNKKNVSFVIKVLIYGVIMMFLFQAQITLALVMYPVLLLISYTYGQKDRSFKALTKLFLAIISIALIISLPTILSSLAESSEAHLSSRLDELHGLLTEQDSSGGDLQSRIVLYQKSLDGFLGSPLWGSFGDRNYGSHSTLLDMLAAYGLLGLIGYCGLLRPFNLVKRDMAEDKAAHSVMRTTLIATILLSTFNVIIVSSEMMQALLVIIPLAMQYLTDRKEVNIETGSN